MKSYKITQKGRTAYNDIKVGNKSEPDYGISRDEWLYLGYLGKVYGVETTDVRIRYGTEGERIFNKFVKLGLAKIEK